MQNKKSPPLGAAGDERSSETELDRSQNSNRDGGREAPAKPGERVARIVRRFAALTFTRYVQRFVARTGIGRAHWIVVWERDGDWVVTVQGVGREGSVVAFFGAREPSRDVAIELSTALDAPILTIAPDGAMAFMRPRPSANAPDSTLLN